MYVIIVGGGRIGSSLTRTLAAIGHEVLVIDKSSFCCEAIEEELGGVSMIGDGCQVHVLREAGIARADVLVATSGRDEDNLASCQIAKELFQVETTMAVVNYPENEPFFEQLGVDNAVNITQLVLTTLENDIKGRPFVHLVNLQGTDRRVVTLQIPPDAAVNGKLLSEVVLPADTFITLIVKAGEPIEPDEETVLGSGDEILAVTTESDEEILWEALTEEAS
jgi:trk system potassium uptake protein TrkA